MLHIPRLNLPTKGIQTVAMCLEADLQRVAPPLQDQVVCKLKGIQKTRARDGILGAEIAEQGAQDHEHAVLHGDFCSDALELLVLTGEALVEIHVLLGGQVRGVGVVEVIDDALDGRPGHLFRRELLLVDEAVLELFDDLGEVFQVVGVRAAACRGQ